MTPSSFTRAYVAHDLGGDLHRLAQRAAVVAASLYVTGLAVGVVIHWANDWLSGDRRPWPVAWGVVGDAQPTPIESTDQVSPELRRVMAQLRLSERIINRDSLIEIVKLRGITQINGQPVDAASNQVLVAVIVEDTKYCELNLARKVGIIAALQCTP